MMKVKQRKRSLLAYIGFTQAKRGIAKEKVIGLLSQLVATQINRQQAQWRTNAMESDKVKAPDIAISSMLELYKDEYNTFKRKRDQQ